MRPLDLLHADAKARAHSIVAMIGRRLRLSEVDRRIMQEIISDEVLGNIIDKEKMLEELQLLHQQAKERTDDMARFQAALGQLKREPPSFLPFPRQIRELLEAARLKRNVLIVGGAGWPEFDGRWVAVPAEDFERLRIAAKALDSRE